MATILQPSIQLTNNNQSPARVSFQVKFTSAELGGGGSSSWRKRFPGMFQPTLPPVYTFSAQVLLKVRRIVPQPFLRGDPPPPLPDPVTLQVKTLSVKLPSSGNTRSLSTDFDYALAANNPFIFDHLHADITLFARMNLAPGQSSFFTFPVDSRFTNDLVLTLDLASPQPNGVVIPS